MKKLSDMFEVSYGNKFDFNKMRRLGVPEGGVHFVGRSSERHGLSGAVAPVEGVQPYAPGLITVALGGTKLLAAFVQERPFYTAQNVAVLTARQEMKAAEKIFVCLCIRHNRFRYSAFGREANRSLRDLHILDREDFPTWVHSTSVASYEGIEKPLRGDTVPPISCSSWSCFCLADIFEVRKGKRLTKANMTSGADGGYGR